MTDWKSGSVAWISFSVTALIRKGNVGRRAPENLAGVEMRLYVKYEVDVARLQ